MVLTIIISLVMFAVLVAVHEFGHFITAKAVGITVHEFSIGMGPVLFSKQKGDTQYSLRAFPIGGYVAMEGEEEISNAPGSFTSKSTPQKMLVVSAGVIMNFITAMILMMILFFMIGVPSNVIRETIPDAPAAQAQIVPGDKIVEIDGKPVSTWSEIVEAIGANQDGAATVGVIKAGEKTETYLDLEVKVNENGANYIGIYPEYKKDVGYAITKGFKETFFLGGQMIEALKLLFTGHVGLDEVVGPVGIVTVVNDATSRGGMYVIYLTALISMNLGLVNILPFPALDGGRLLFMIIPLITRRPIKEATEIKWHYAGFLLLMALTIFITLKDINQFILHLF